MATITIQYDQDADSPREWDNVGTLVIPPNRYVTGDIGAEFPGPHIVPPADLVSWACGELDRGELAECARDKLDKRNGYTKADAVCDYLENTYAGGWAEYPETLRDLISEYCVILPVYAYVHGNVALNTRGFSCPWDSGQVGAIWCTLEQVRDEWGGDIEKARAYLNGEIETLNKYYSEGAYGYSIESEDGSDDDSCWGFLGYDIETNGILDYLPAEWADAARESMGSIGKAVELPALPDLV